MSSFIGTAIVGVILIAIVALIIRSMVKDKKQGKSSCGGSCGCCPNSSMCHRAPPESGSDAKPSSERGLNGGQ